MNIFVFGSNRQGRHGKGAALDALKKHGAIYGVASGRQGDSYAIITKELRSGHPPVDLDEIAEGVRAFLVHAREYSEHTFFVTPIGCGLAGFTPSQIAPLFKGAPLNVKLPSEFRRHLRHPHSHPNHGVAPVPANKPSPSF